jgi:hypothetical protein
MAAADDVLELLLDASVPESFEHAEAPRSATAAKPAAAIRLLLAEFIWGPHSNSVDDVCRRPRR